ncbi:creatininase [Alkalihalobacillus alcalophilus ATCC 27647 = CGMCC 1.3604]|uniref:Creatininase n=1 Tax=Alkalihalobacillus alcalophilus ATCC 27647 = CGMCC 1.3604 TaxID=1218173 RepID=A0A094WIG1_ALKAL|nr:creatininase family protein [Alkalihalobacillus alcalophilus]KGA97579.1 creatininase [Alkalihalobacillus alcalophilus ATCC 27647 = CGMCC 1.3604]MED1562957.1 creatininase family protein [Alkalihalobacillus alcalophilus]
MKAEKHGKAWQDFFLPRLSTNEVAALEKEKGAVVLPIAAIEQHGPHLPTYTDTLIAEGLLEATFELLNREDNIWLLPPLPYGKSTEHFGHPGTFTLSETTLQHVILDLAESVKASGFTRFVLFNTHGGNLDLINMIAREVRIQTGLMVFKMSGMDYKGVLNGLYTDKELTYGIHGGDVETSIILALQEGWVHMDVAQSQMYQPYQDGEIVIDIKGSPSVAWIADDVSDCGTSGDATLATRDKGIETIARLSEPLAKTLQKISTFEMDVLKNSSIVSEVK